MTVLPKGYYVVRAEDAPENEFLFRGVTYGLEPGINVFPSIHEAAAAAECVPVEILQGLDYPAFSTPVIIFTPGRHITDKFFFEKSLTLIGNGAGINPNIRQDDGTMEANPDRAQNESLLHGSYWFGKVRVENPEVTDIIIDGFSSYRTRFYDTRKTGGKVNITFRNMIYITGCGNNLHTFTPVSAENPLDRTVKFENIRVKDFDDLDYGGMFVCGNARKFVFDGICYDTTGQIFGPTMLAGNLNNASAGFDCCDISVKNSYFANLTGDRALHIASNDPSVRLKVNMEGCLFRDASPEGTPVIYIEAPGACPSVRINDCIFENTKAPAPMISVKGDPSDTVLTNIGSDGFSEILSTVKAPENGGPDMFELPSTRSDSGTEDNHTVIPLSEADFGPLDAIYEGRSVYWGDQHTHSNSGGTSDGKTPIGDWPKGMDEKKIDFIALVDHRQMRGFFLPEWDESRFIIGTEPGTRFTDLTAVRCGQDSVHYNMLFPHKYGLAMVLANFPEFEFRGDELTGSFKYPSFTREHFRELAAYVQSIGGIMVHPHPKTMLASDDPLDYYFGEHTFLETIYGAPQTHASFRNYELWCKILAAGKHMYTSSGSDTHGAPSNAALSAFYTSEKSGLAFFNQFRSGDFTVGNVAMQMCIDGHPMGSEIGPSTGSTLLLRLNEFYQPMFKENTCYELRIITDKGLAFAAQYNGKLPQAVALEVKDRKFYRAEVMDLTHGYRVAIGNPIWTDRSC